jgi:hypothetical protein
MWKSFFLATGFFLLLLGAETLVVQKFALANGSRVPAVVSDMGTAAANPAWITPGSNGPVLRREIRTSDWMPWSLLAAGAITVLYTLSLPHQATAAK